jgi:hypothetical protein
MNRLGVALLGVLLAACRPTGQSGMAEARADEPSANLPSGVAVVELFTSEGCSSCPPADAVLADLAKKKLPLYLLAFHVDYWDEIGWPDRFASPDYTARQRTYARSFGSDELFTPEMIVNGVEPFTGSDRTRAERSIARALSHRAPVSLSIGARAMTADTITVDWSAIGAPADAVIDIAVVERSTSTDVRAGENAHRVLHHTNVVRAFVVASAAKGKDSTRVVVPASLERQDGEVIAYVQRPSAQHGMSVLGAARARLPD